LGWITGIVIAIASGLLAAARDRLARRYAWLDDAPTVGVVTGVTFGLLLAWRWLLPHFPLLALDSASSFAVATIVAALLLSAATWWLGPWSPLNWPERGDTIEIFEGQYRRTEYRRRRRPAERGPAETETVDRERADTGPAENDAADVDSDFADADDPPANSRERRRG
ncbi:MAG: hypothetical protein ACKO38_03970, partial [Planctomycetota bacterium]